MRERLPVPFFVLVHLFLVIGAKARAQNDSLWSVWNNLTGPDSARLQAIQVLSRKAVFGSPDSGMSLARRHFALAERTGHLVAMFEAYHTLVIGCHVKSDFRTALVYLDSALTLAERIGDRKRIAGLFSNMSTMHRNLGDQSRALDLLQRSARIDEELSNQEGLAGTYNNIGNVYTDLGETQKALENYQRAAQLYGSLSNLKGQASSLLNLGSTHLELGQLERALDEFRRSRDLYLKMGSKLELGMVQNNIGRVLGLMGRSPQAHQHLDTAGTILENLGNKRSLANTYLYRGTLLLEEGRSYAAIDACNTGMALAEEHGLLQQKKACLECLARAYAAVGDHRRAFEAQSRFITAGDSLESLNDRREVTRLEVQRQFQEQQIADSVRNVRERFERELAHQEQLGEEKDRRNALLLSGIAVLALAGGLWNRLRYTRRSHALVQREKERSDDLLHNILPEAVAQELKEKGHADARHFDAVTILFTDFKGFTQLSERLTPQELIAEINTCFSAFDRIVSDHGVEKIKTIGDAYMAAGGIPIPNATHAHDVVHAALAIRDFMVRHKREKDLAGEPTFEVRIGIHSGPVVAGIVGIKKFAYDIWGDSVNTAARMESTGEVGHVNISEGTYQLLKGTDQLVFIPRGRVKAKGKGEIEMFFVQRGPDQDHIPTV